MCGIAGKINLKKSQPIDPMLIYKMLAAIHHRGPDEKGVYANAQIGLGSARLSIIDLVSGKQPISNEDGSIWVVFNGEIYNYIELRAELESAGHVFRTQSDTEVLVHLYEERKSDWLLRLNGQFAIALWDQREETLILARDRFGIRPIYYTEKENFLLFASEAKALFAHPGIEPEIDPISLAQIFTFWTTLTSRSSFRHIKSVPPGHYAKIKRGKVEVNRYWQLDMALNQDAPKSLNEAAEELRWLLNDSIRLRLRSDVPVGSYLSGGLDSSSISALASQQAKSRLKTFSIAFSDQLFDESQHQTRTNEHLDIDNRTIHSTLEDIGAVFPQVIAHAEMPLLRTAPAPMFLLSKMVHESGFKVVLTGEGADEILGGYNIFKEAKIRRFWARQPNSECRPLLLERLYPYLSKSAFGGVYLRKFFEKNLGNTDDVFYSHRLRWENTSRCLQFLSPEIQAEIKGYDPLAELAENLPPEFGKWNTFAQAQYLETTVFLSGYLLSSQGDRMGMANSVEGRYPFLDPRVVDFSVGLPTSFKMLGLREKVVLKRAMRDLLPSETINRHKQPYRAPIRSVFFGKSSPAYVEENLSSQKLKETGFFDEKKVERLKIKGHSSGRISETEEMALVGVLSVQLLNSMWRS
ncbi:MAG: asparagine synthase (glutamine-hydrolyzing) [Chloroflexi bacterium]|nr:MAG: asparagine synthase (glutamine-hydrolyzing) [Chloroflexota bacterium]